MVKGGDSCSEGRRFKSQRSIMDVLDIFHIDLLQKLYCLFEKTENKQKRGTGLAHLKKKLIGTA